MGFPCPDTMELSPIGLGSIRVNGSTAECRCPPGTAQSVITSKCHKLFTKGPCEAGQFFGPRTESSPGKNAMSVQLKFNGCIRLIRHLCCPTNRPKKRWGICRAPDNCTKGMVSWPQDSKCYTLFSKGPCAKGKLLVANEEGLAECRCSREGELALFYHPETETCHEHYSKGPCPGQGDLFLPNGKCGCISHLPHYHEESDQCYELNLSGPCPQGQVFTVTETNNVKGKYAQAACQCKQDHVAWSDGYCYRIYTRGPCAPDEFIVSNNTCLPNPCPKGRLYFPEEKTCYRIGSQGPCQLHQVVVFDFTSRPSIDGISYNGVCGCAGILSNLDQTCSERGVPNESACESNPSMVELNGECFKLYTRGPCGPGEWLVPLRANPNRVRVRGKCECKPDYTPYESENGIRGCHAPSVGIARYLMEYTMRKMSSPSHGITNRRRVGIRRKTQN